MTGVAALRGRRILVTRAAEDAADWAARLSAMGASPVVLPCLTIEPIDDVATRTALVRALETADWIVVTSPRGVAALQTLHGAGLSGRHSIAAVGPATARACQELLGRTPLVADETTSAGLGRRLAALLGTGGAGAECRVVLVGAAGGREEAEAALTAQGAIVSRIDVYRSVPVPVAARKYDLAGDGVEDVLLASPSAVQGLINRALVPRTAQMITIGPTTSAAATAAGLRVSAEARRPTLEAMLEAMT